MSKLNLNHLKQLLDEHKGALCYQGRTRRMGEAFAQLPALIEALEKYGWHGKTCAYYSDENWPSDGPCTCGWSNIQKTIKPNLLSLQDAHHTFLKDEE